MPGTFNEILERAMRATPAKIELHGLLVPCFEEYDGRIFRFKLCTESQEYFADIPRYLLPLARKAGWDEVFAKGRVEYGVIHIEQLKSREAEEPIVASLDGPPFELERLRETIDRQGKLEPSLDYAV